MRSRGSGEQNPTYEAFIALRGPENPITGLISMNRLLNGPNANAKITGNPFYALALCPCGMDHAVISLTRSVPAFRSVIILSTSTPPFAGSGVSPFCSPILATPSRLLNFSAPATASASPP